MDPRLSGMVMALAAGDRLANWALADLLEETGDPRADKVRSLRHDLVKVAEAVHKRRNHQTSVIADHYMVLHSQVGRWRRGSVVTAAVIVGAAGQGTDVMQRLIQIHAVGPAARYEADPEGGLDEKGNWVPSRREWGRLAMRPYLQELVIECRTRGHVNDLVRLAADGKASPPDVSAAFAGEGKDIVASLFPELAAEILRL